MNTRSLHFRWHHFVTKRSMLRYLVGPALPAGRAVSFRRHLVDCPQCRNQFDLLQSNLAHSTGLTPLRSTQPQREALFEQVMAGLEPAGQPAARVAAAEQARPATSPLAWRLGATALVAAALVALVWIAPPLPAPQPTSPESTAVRGDHTELPPAALGISGVDSQGSEYEVVYSQGVCLQDALRFYATVRDERLNHVLVFAVQKETTLPVWYFPDSTQANSFPLPQVGEPWLFPDEIPVAPNHEAGPLLIVALFAASEVTVDQAEGLWTAIRQAEPQRDGFATAMAWMDLWADQDYVVQGTPVAVLPCPGGHP